MASNLDPLQVLDDYNREASREWQLLLDTAKSESSAAPVHARLRRLSAGLAASAFERDALLAQI